MLTQSNMDAKSNCASLINNKLCFCHSNDISSKRDQSINPHYSPSKAGIQKKRFGSGFYQSGF